MALIVTLVEDVIFIPPVTEVYPPLKVKKKTQIKIAQKITYLFEEQVHFFIQCFIKSDGLYSGGIYAVFMQVSCTGNHNHRFNRWFALPL